MARSAFTSTASPGQLLNALGGLNIAAALIDYLRDPSWGSALSEDDAEMLKAMLAESSAGGIDQAALAQGELALEAGPGFADMEAPELPAAVRELVEILLAERIIATERLALNAGEAKLLQDWIVQVRAYLTAPAHPAPTQGLVQVLAAP